MTVLLVRHGRSTANTARVLAGRSPGVHLDDTGREQAEQLAERLGGLPVREIVASPLERCAQTVAPLAARLGVEPTEEADLVEVDYGSWTGRGLAELSGEPLWPTVQRHPAAARFPDGESMAQMSARAIRAIRAHDARLAEAHGGDVLWVACSHGDIIKAVLADALGMHLDAFQRLHVDPASISAIRYTEHRPFVLRVNDSGDRWAGVVPAAGGADRGSDATPGGNVP